jgi:predicted alpha/beta-fold hydrolase
MEFKKNNFKAAWWLPSPHLQTLWAAVIRRKHKINLRSERMELPDGDFLDLAWLDNPSDAPIVVILHGLNGNADSRYAVGILNAIQKKGLRGLLIHFRGCSKEPNRLPRAYHSGETGDIEMVIERIREREPNTPLYAIGYSLGGNVLLKWLGETGISNPLRAAAAVSIPFELDKAADYLNTGFFRFYQWWLVRGLKKFHQRKFKNHPLEKKFKNVHKIKTFWEFDHQITAPLHGFSSAQEYYTQSSSRQYLKSIAVPTLIIQAKDDPFLPESALPQASELSSFVTMELLERGGHVGFIQGKFPWRPEYWLENSILEYFSSKCNFSKRSIH